jgi:hypothetical protein
MGPKHKHYDVIVAWAAGEEVEIKDDDGIWVPFTNAKHVIFYEDMEYRIKPKTVKKEGWVNVFPAFVYSSKESADGGFDADKRITCIRIEWEEEE